MSRFKKVPQINEGKIAYGDGIVDDIVLLAVTEIPYVELEDTNTQQKQQTRSKSIKVRKEKDGIHVDVTVKIHFSQSVSDIAFKIQESVRHTVEAMTEFHVANVNVSISDVTFDDKVEETPIQANENNQEG